MILALLAAALLAQQPSFDPMAYVRAHRAADAALVAGRLGEARSGFESCLAMSPNNPTVAYALACAEARSKNTAEALEWLDRAVKWGYADADVAVWDEDLASLRYRKEFVEVLAGMNRLRAAQVFGDGLIIRDGRNKHLGVAEQEVAVHPRGQFVVVGGTDGVMQVLDAKSGHALRRSPSLGSEIEALEFDNPGDQVVALTRDGRLHFWKISGESVATSVASCRSVGGRTWDMPPNHAFVRFNSSGDRMLVVDATGNMSSLRDNRGAVIRAWNQAFMLGHQAVVAWSFDGALIAVAEAQTVQFFDGSIGKFIGAALETPAEIGCIDFQPGGSLLATGHCDGTVRVWNSASRQPSGEFRLGTTNPGEKWLIDAVALSPDGRWLAAGLGDNWGLEVINLSTGERIRRFDCTENCCSGIPHELHWSADSNRLWFNLCREGGQVDNLSVDARLPETLVYGGRSPRVGKSGLAVALRSSGSVLALDAISGRCLWERPILGREGELQHTSSGYFSADFEDFDEVFVEDCGVNDDERPLAPLVAVLFDPKRVRAARDAVAIVPVRR